MAAVLDEPLVGREVEVKRLERALDFLDTGLPACIAVEGEPGIGKTRLLNELRARAEARHHIVLSGRAAEFARDAPFGVVVDAFDAFLAEHRAEEIESWDGEVVAELAAIFPALRASTPAQPQGLGEERYRAHRAMRWLLERVASGRHLVIALDDLHWADEASIELIGALLRQGPAAPVLLAVAFRGAQAPERLEAALAVPEVRRLALEPLSEPQARELVSQVDAKSQAVLFRESGGNPFYLQQLVKASGGSRASSTAKASPELPDVEVPAAVSAALAEELDAVSAPARVLLEAAAVAGEPFDPDLAAEIAEQEVDGALRALDELIAADLVRATALPRRFVFRHALVRRAVEASIPGGRALVAHERAAAALRARGAPASERARHVEYAATIGDEEAISVFVEAAAQTRSRGPATAARWLEAGLRLLPDGDPRQVELRVELANALRAGGELERCRSTLLEAIERVPADQRERRAELEASCAAVESWLGHNDAAHRRLLAAWRELEDRSSPAGVALAIELSVDGLYNLDFEQFFSTGEAALNGAEALRDPVLIATAAAALCLGSTAAGRIADARAYREKAVELVDALSDDQLAPRLEVLFYLAWSESFLEHFDAARAHAERGIAISRSTGDGRLIVPLTLASATPHERQGRLREAIEIARRAVEAARLTDNPQYLFWALWELGWRQYLAGDLDGAIESCEESNAVARRLAGSFMRSGSGEPGWTLGLAMIKRGDFEAGREQFLAGIGGAQFEHVIPLERSWAREHLALIELARGRPEAALEIADQHAREAEPLELKVPVAIAARTRAAVLLATGEAGEAVEHAERSLAAAGEAGALLEAAWSRTLLGRALLAAGETDRAIATMREAERDLDACGAERERDALRAELRKLGARTERRGPAPEAGAEGLASLTKREREIADLVADRRTNREIAEALFLSTKTVESHLRNIFGKLGVSSRVEVARAVEAENAASDA